MLTGEPERLPGLEKALFQHFSWRGGTIRLFCVIVVNRVLTGGEPQGNRSPSTPKVPFALGEELSVETGSPENLPDDTERPGNPEKKGSCLVDEECL